MLAIVLKYVLVAVEVICGLLLITVVLLQKTKGQGMGMAFGAGMGESLFGSQVGNVLTKVTVVLAIIFMVNTTVLSLLGSGKKSSSVADRFDAAPTAQQAGPATQKTPVPSGTSVPDAPASTDAVVPDQGQAAPQANEAVDIKLDTPSPAVEPVTAPAETKKAVAADTKPSE